MRSKTQICYFIMSKADSGKWLFNFIDLGKVTPTYQPNRRQFDTRMYIYDKFEAEFHLKRIQELYPGIEYRIAEGAVTTTYTLLEESEIDPQVATIIQGDISAEDETIKISRGELEFILATGMGYAWNEAGSIRSKNSMEAYNNVQKERVNITNHYFNKEKKINEKD